MRSSQTPGGGTDQPPEPAGWRQWSISLGWITVLAGATTGLIVGSNGVDSVRFVGGVSVGLLAVSGVTGWCLGRAADGSITLPTTLTLARGAALAVFAGFLSISQESLAWMPALLFGIAAAGDAVDGALARATDSVSDLGGRLDTEMDGLVVLVGTLVVVADGRVPTVFLLVGLARYAFVFGIWQRKRRGLAVYELPPSQLRRLLGGTAMSTIWVALLPVVPTAWAWLLAAVVFVPFVFNFTLDWLAVSGRRR